MATSSIFEKIRINDPEKAEAFIDALTAAEHMSKRKVSSPAKPPVTDIEEIRQFMIKRFPQ